ncbi:MAG: hypothetical protein DPW21_00385 [Anaerolineae bacterium]|nr:hypothetical protein [Chloroflexi bacterium CFX2]MCQ3945139.1 hypothetical protein [Anaerolineae bacterium]
MREGDHHLEVGCVAVEGTAHFPSIGNAGNLFAATGAAVRAALVGWKGSTILVQEVDILHCPAPINVTSVMRLVIGAAFQQRNCAEWPRRNEVAGQEQE